MPVVLKLVAGPAETTLPDPSEAPTTYDVPFTGLVGELPVGYLTTKYAAAPPADAVKLPLIPVCKGVNTNPVGWFAGAEGGALVTRDISSIEAGGSLLTEPSFDHINTRRLVVPAYAAGKQTV